jgi:hypothetical protein
MQIHERGHTLTHRSLNVTAHAFASALVSMPLGSELTISTNRRLNSPFVEAVGGELYSYMEGKGREEGKGSGAENLGHLGSDTVRPSQHGRMVPTT